MITFFNFNKLLIFGNHLLWKVSGFLCSFVSNSSSCSSKLWLETIPLGKPQKEKIHIYIVQSIRAPFGYGEGMWLMRFDPTLYLIVVKSTNWATCWLSSGFLSPKANTCIKSITFLQWIYHNLLWLYSNHIICYFFFPHVLVFNSLSLYPLLFKMNVDCVCMQGWRRTLTL